MVVGQQEIMPLSEVRIGMTGVGKTIIAGEEITEFSAEVLGIIDQPGDESDFIVVRVSGAAIGRAGGIAQGMSGSPIYVEGKLIGALSRAASWSKDLTPVGLVTPIEPMLAVLDSMQESLSAPAPEALLDVREVLAVASPMGLAFDPGIPGSLVSVPLSAPLLCSGLSARALDSLMGTAPVARPGGTFGDFVTLSPAAEDALSMAGLRRFGLSLSPLSMAPVASYGDPQDIVPGGSLGIALATGDVTIGALGTVTYRDGERLIGFGHPFISNGSAAFPMTAVQIFETIKAYDASFKLGALGRPLGTLLQDRMPAVGASLGPLPRMIELTVDAGVEDDATVTSRSFTVEIVPETRLLPELVFATGLAAIDEALGRIGEGTVDVEFTLEGGGLPHAVTRRDVFISTTDIAVYAPWQLADIVAFLAYNPFVDPQLRRLSMTMSLTEEIRAVEISDLTIDQLVYAPGDTIHYTLELQTYRGERRLAEGDITIPEDLFTDTIAVRAYGGPRRIEGGETPNVFASIDDLVTLIEGLPSYDVLTVELFALSMIAPYADAWVGIDSIEIPIDGHVVYDQREVIAYLLEGE
jgi:hypothetical protein